MSRSRAEKVSEWNSFLDWLKFVALTAIRRIKVLERIKLKQDSLHLMTATFYSTKIHILRVVFKILPFQYRVNSI